MSINLIIWAIMTFGIWQGPDRPIYVDPSVVQGITTLTPVSLEREREVRIGAGRKTGF